STAGSSGTPVRPPSSRPLPENRSASGPSALILPSMSGTPKTTGRMSAISQGQASQPKPTGNLSPTQKPPEALIIDGSTSPATQQPLDTPASSSGELPAAQKPPEALVIESNVSPIAPNRPEGQNQPPSPTRRRNSGVIPAAVAGTALAGTAVSGSTPS